MEAPEGVGTCTTVGCRCTRYVVALGMASFECDQQWQLKAQDRDLWFRLQKSFVTRLLRTKTPGGVSTHLVYAGSMMYGTGHETC